MSVVRHRLRPEFLNRLDEVVLFTRLGRDQMTGLVRSQLAAVQAWVGAPESGPELVRDVDDAAVAWLAEAGYDPVYGARPLRRLIQTAIQTPLAGMLLAEDAKPGDIVRVVKGGEGVVLERVVRS